MCSCTCKLECLLGASGGMPPLLNLDPLRLLLMQSGTRLLFNTCDKTIITILNFKIYWAGGGGGIPGPPPYGTLSMYLNEKILLEHHVTTYNIERHVTTYNIEHHVTTYNIEHHVTTYNI